MNFEKINNSLSLFANVGVIVGIVFLAFEIQQNTEMMKSQTRDAMTGKLMDYAVSIGSDIGLADMYARGNSGRELDLASGEIAAYTILTQANFRDVGKMNIINIGLDLFDSDEFTPRLQQWERLLMNSESGYRRIWPNIRDSFSPDFKELIDSLTE